jgi:photosystem II stability/assembly factor-like uncharacterized protein
LLNLAIRNKNTTIMVVNSTKKILFSCILVLSIIGTSFYFINKTKDFKGRKLEPGEFLFLQRAYPSGKLKQDNIEEIENWKQNKTLASRQTNSVNWQFVGPENVGGRITDIEIPSNNPSTYIIGSATGGIFRSINAGSSWEPIFDSQNTLSIGDMDISKTNNSRILVGTGEANGGGGSTNFDGTGVYLSNDGGDTWQSKGLANVGSIGKVIIDPTNSNNMYVGSMGLLYAQTINRGVYKSTDGGTTWAKTLYVSDKTGVIDMAINPINPNIIYAATWERTRTPENRVYAGPTSNIYKSVNAGLTWTILANGLPTTSDKGRISIDISNSNPSILYATYTNDAGNSFSLFKTIDAGTTWTSISTSSIANSTYYNWWFGGVFINPTNPNTIFLAGFDSNYSLNGGATWTYTPGVTNAIHVDNHTVAFNSNNEVLLGNDGGLYKSSNGTAFTKINNLPISQAYRMDVNPNNANEVYAGFQDNGTWRTLTGSANDWNSIFGGDGFQPAVNPVDTNILFCEYQYGKFQKSTTNASFFFTADNGVSATEPRNWDMPYVISPSNASVMYLGTNSLYKSIDSGSNWTSISSNLSKAIYTGTQKYGTITTIDVSPLNSNIIFIGTDDGNVWKTIDGGVTYIKISNFLPNKWVTKVKASPTNVNQVYVTYSGYRYNLFDSNLYVSNDLGNSWQDLSTDLPNTPLSDIEITSNNTLYVASDIGVLVSNNLGVTWDFLGSNMPAVVVTDLVLHTSSNFLFASTFGRGVYKIDLTQVNLATNTVATKILNIKVYPNPANEFLYLDIESDKIKEFNAEFFDIKGNLVKKFQLENTTIGKQTIKMNIESLQKGIYILKINNESKSQKIVVN